MVLVNDPQSNWYAAFVVFCVFSWISLVSIVITLVVFLSKKGLRRFPHRIVIYLGFSLLILFIPWAGNSFLGVVDTRCDGTFEWARTGWCQFGAWALVFGSNAAAWWWAFQSAVLFWNIGLLRDPETIKKAEPFFHIITWTYALAASFTLTFAQNAGASFGMLPLCTPIDVGVLTWLLFMMPFMIFLLLVLVCTIVCIARIWLTPSQSSSSSSLRRGAQITIIAFSLVYLNIVVILIALIAYTTSHQDEAEQTLRDYYFCIWSGFVPWEQCKTHTVYPPALVWYCVMSFSTLGTLFAILFLLLKRESRKTLTRTISRISSRGFSQGDSTTANS